MASDGTLKFDTSLNTEGLQEGAGKLDSIAKNALGVFAGNLMTKATEAVINLGKEALNSGMSFEASMAKVSTLFNGTDDEFSQLSDTILELSSATGLAADGLAEAAYSALSASVPAQDLGTILEKSAKLAAAGFTDVDTALSATAKTMNAYGESGEEAIDKVQKVLIQTQNLGITTVGELGASLAQVTPTAAAFGVSFEQVGASLAVMTAQGTPTAQATTQLNSLIAELGKSGTTAAKNLEKAAEGSKYAGMSFNEMMEAGATLDEVLGLMQTSADASGLSMVDMFSSIEAGKAAMSIFTQNGEVFHNDLMQMGTDADVVGDAYAKVSDTLEFKSQQIKTSLSNIAISLFQMASGPLSDAADAAAGALAEIQKGFSENGLAGVADAILGMMEGAADTLENFDWGAAADSIVAKITGFIEGDGLGSLLGALVTIFTGIVNGISSMLPSLQPALVELISYVVTSLLDQLPAILDCALELIMGLAQGILNALPVLVAALPEIIVSIVQFLVSSIPEILNAGIELLMALVDALPVIIEALVAALPDLVTSIVTTLAASAPDILAAGIELLMALVEAIPTIVLELVAALPDIIVAIIDGLIAAGPQVLSSAKELWGQITEAVPELISKLGEAVPEIINGIVSGLANGASEVWDAACQLGSDILGGIKSFLGINSPSTVMADQGDYIIQGLLNGLATMPERAAAVFQQVLNDILSWGQQMVSNASTAMTNMLSKISSVLQGLPGKVWTHLVNTVNKVISWGQRMVSNASTAMTNMLSKISSVLQGLPGKVWEYLSQAASKVVSWGSDLASKGAAAAKNLFDAVVNGLKSLPDEIKSIGSDIVNGLWNGISSGWDWLKDKVSGLAKGLLDSAKDALGIKSPSTEFRDEVGRWLPPGISEGFEDSMPKAIKNMERQASSMVARMQAAVSASAGTLSLNAAGPADLRALSTVGTVVNNDNHFEQQNTYNVPVATPSEVSKAQREALRNMVGGVK